MALSPKRRGEDVSIYMYSPGRKRYVKVRFHSQTHTYTFVLSHMQCFGGKKPPTSESSTSYDAMCMLLSHNTNEPCFHWPLRYIYIFFFCVFFFITRIWRCVNQLENLFPTQNLQSYSEFILSLIISRRFEGQRGRTSELTKSSMARGWSCIVWRSGTTQVGPIKNIQVIIVCPAIAQTIVKVTT